MDEVRGDEPVVVALDGRPIHVSVNTALGLVVVLLPGGASIEFTPEVAISFGDILTHAAKAVSSSP
jgi:hypothetical protein